MTLSAARVRRCWRKRHGREKATRAGRRCFPKKTGVERVSRVFPFRFAGPFVWRVVALWSGRERAPRPRRPRRRPVRALCASGQRRTSAAQATGHPLPSSPFRSGQPHQHLICEHPPAITRASLHSPYPRPPSPRPPRAPDVARRSASVLAAPWTLAAAWLLRGATCGSCWRGSGQGTWPTGYPHHATACGSTAWTRSVSTRLRGCTPCWRSGEGCQVAVGPRRPRRGRLSATMSSSW
eukprot:81301-Chlamydomonas_euryale.AAC.1